MTTNPTTRDAEGSAEGALRLLHNGNARLVSIFGSVDENGAKRVHYIADVNREYRCINVPVIGALPSATLISPAAAWHERELHDQYGIDIDGHPDLRPLVSHPADYRFLQVQGVGVCEVPVGPVHAGIIEPGHFRFSVMGDSVLHLEPRLFYTHKGTETLFEGSEITDGPMLAESVSGDNCFAHAVAYCQSVENAFGISVPPRGRSIRLVGLEIERMMAHIGDLGALCGDVGCAVPAAYTARIKESLLQASTRFFGTRYWRGIAMPGGVRRDISAENARDLSSVIAQAAADFADMTHIILDTPSVLNRFEGTGVLSTKVARDLGVVGPVARASGVRIDVRHDHPYGHYRNITVETPHFQQGDVLCRARMRIEETRISARLIQETLHGLAAGIISATVPRDGSAEGFSAVESPRGELLYWIRIRNGLIVRCHIKSPSFQNWPSLPFAVAGNISADFPLINKSFNLSYSGCDR
ncbi:MAG: NADH-quinone oxidoreductase subunit C [Terracidiphilus sp.]|jgi:Ni,Fe-hydrogenase III large subunit